MYSSASFPPVLFDDAVPKVGSTLVSSSLKPILTLMEDTGPGMHDTIVAACNHQLYERVLGIAPDEHHDSCTNNLHTSLRELGFKLTDDPEEFYTPQPWNLWMCVRLGGAGRVVCMFPGRQS